MKFSIANILLVILAFLQDCYVKSFCGRQDMSCSDQLWNESNPYPEEACTVKHHAIDSSECHLLDFKKKIENDINIDTVILKSHVDEEFKVTDFDIVFNNISWRNAKIKYSKVGAENETNLCRTYLIWKNVTVPLHSRLINNCTFSYSSDEGENYYFEYELDDPFVYKKYIFKIPDYEFFHDRTPLNDHQIFSYVDITDPECLTLHLQPLSLKHNVSGYLVTIFKTEHNSELSAEVTRVSLNSKNDFRYKYCKLESSAGYYFSITAISSECVKNVCRKSLTPKICVVHLKSTWAIASCIGVFLVVSLIVFIVALLRFKKKKKRARRDFLKGKFKTSIGEVKSEEPETPKNTHLENRTFIYSVLSSKEESEIRDKDPAFPRPQHFNFDLNQVKL